MRVKKSLPQMSIRELKKKVQSHLRTSIRYGIGTSRIKSHLHKRLFEATGLRKKDPSIVILIDTGEQATFASVGEVYEKFLQTGVLQNYSGFGLRPAKFDDEHFEDAPVRIMTFAESFVDMDYDCRENICYIPEIDDIFLGPPEEEEDKVQSESESTTQESVGKKCPGKARRHKNRKIAKRKAQSKYDKSNAKESQQKVSDENTDEGKKSEKTIVTKRGSVESSVEVTSTRKKRKLKDFKVTKRKVNNDDSTDEEASETDEVLNTASNKYGKLRCEESSRGQQQSKNREQSQGTFMESMMTDGQKTNPGSAERYSPGHLPVSGNGDMSEGISFQSEIEGGQNDFIPTPFECASWDLMSQNDQEKVVTLESDISSSQNSLQEPPDFLNASYDTLKMYAGLSGQDQFIFSD